MKVIKKMLNKMLNLTKKIFVGVKTEEVKLSDDFNLWSHRMIESLIRDMDILQRRIQKIEEVFKRYY